MTVHIRKFDVKQIKPHRIILCVGKRGTGKRSFDNQILRSYL